MALLATETEVRSILTRAGGYLRPVCSHSLQPYRGCTFGNALCGVGCYVQHNPWLTRGQPWGSFLEVRTNAAAAYRAQFERERDWARRERAAFAVFLSSSTDPFLPQEDRYGATAAVLQAMTELPPDELIVQTHTHRVVERAALLRAVADRCCLRVHLSIEGDRDRLPGLPPPASTVAQRLDAARTLRARGLRVVITCAPLHPIADPDRFFAAVAAAADAVVLDHFIGGDGSADGQRTRSTPLVAAMQQLVTEATRLPYRDRMAAIAERHLPGRVGLGQDGFAGRFARIRSSDPATAG
jgi:DNA repair photolyase